MAEVENGRVATEDGAVKHPRIAPSAKRAAEVAAAKKAGRAPEKGRGRLPVFAARVPVVRGADAPREAEVFASRDGLIVDGERVPFQHVYSYAYSKKKGISHGVRVVDTHLQRGLDVLLPEADDAARLMTALQTPGSAHELSFSLVPWRGTPSAPTIAIGLFGGLALIHALFSGWLYGLLAVGVLALLWTALLSLTWRTKVVLSLEGVSSFNLLGFRTGNVRRPPRPSRLPTPRKRPTPRKTPGLRAGCVVDRGWLCRVPA